VSPWCLGNENRPESTTAGKMQIMERLRRDDSCSSSSSSSPSSSSAAERATTRTKKLGCDRRPPCDTNRQNRDFSRKSLATTGAGYSPGAVAPIWQAVLPPCEIWRVSKSPTDAAAPGGWQRPASRCSGPSPAQADVTCPRQAGRKNPASLRTVACPLVLRPIVPLFHHILLASLDPVRKNRVFKQP